jgi:CheY-like chemotaxis protein
MIMTDKRLLIMDDEPDFCDFVGHIGESLGYRVTKVTDSRKFKVAYRETNPDMIVIDMVMPELDGFDLVNWLVDQKTEAKLLIITGHNPLYAKAAQMQSTAKGVGQVEAFTKPVSVSKLRAALTS